LHIFIERTSTDFITPQIRDYKHLMINKESLNTAKNKTVLLVEDHKFSQMALKKMLEQSGINVIPVENGSEAVKVFKVTRNIDMVLMDIKMPVMDGYSALREIKKINPEIKVIAETAYGLDGDKETIIDAGFDGYLAKPITKKKLEEIVELYLR
jgi:two-component system, cell cycle response regulator DivK